MLKQLTLEIFFLEQGELNLAESAFKYLNPDKGEISKIFLSRKLFV